MEELAKMALADSLVPVPRATVETGAKTISMNANRILVNMVALVRTFWQDIHALAFRDLQVKTARSTSTIVPAIRVEMEVLASIKSTAFSACAKYPTQGNFARMNWIRVCQTNAKTAQSAFRLQISSILPATVNWGTRAAYATRI